MIKQKSEQIQILKVRNNEIMKDIDKYKMNENLMNEMR